MLTKNVVGENRSKYNKYYSNEVARKPEVSRIVVVMVTIAEHLHECNECCYGRETDADCQHWKYIHIEVVGQYRGNTQYHNQHEHSFVKFLGLFHNVFVFCFVRLFSVQYINILLNYVNINIIKNSLKFDLIIILDYTLYSI